ncbi:uncharacterized protein MELLADRAFT_123565 [Melampsora larici-populina 98AG31]|uniref:Secreted protein n=1 Tax=Melampsora larici-populina (strain 98AG31 / pathotype 3-4-7) TaxID=747676 RepID=F4R635_MELLP|nr:uncharacterized protein MELLADRAFT_123565 [Melampsora larici-populina 98AG31]EGG12151.1 secreted protein [Melampsora larici-populina 98AG31]
MLQVFLKISILLFSMLIHKVLGATNAPPPTVHSCNIKFTILGDRAECTGGGVVHNCAYKSCWLAGHQYISMTECKLAKSTDKRTSHQQCAQYEFVNNDLTKPLYFKCRNPGLVDYICSDNANNIGKILGCSDCYL